MQKEIFVVSAQEWPLSRSAGEGCAGRMERFGPSGNSWDWRDLQGDLVHPPCSRRVAQGCSGPGVVGFGVSPRMEPPQLPWATCAGVWVGKQAFLGISLLFLCAPRLLWAPLREGRLHPHPVLPQGIPSLFMHRDETSLILQAEQPLPVGKTLQPLY